MLVSTIIQKSFASGDMKDKNSEQVVGVMRKILVAEHERIEAYSARIRSNGAVPKSSAPSEHVESAGIIASTHHVAHAPASAAPSAHASSVSTSGKPIESAVKKPGGNDLKRMSR